MHGCCGGAARPGARAAALPSESKSGHLCTGPCLPPAEPPSDARILPKHANSYLIRHPEASWHDVPDMPKAALSKAALAQTPPCPGPHRVSSASSDPRPCLSCLASIGIGATSAGMLDKFFTRSTSRVVRTQKSSSGDTIKFLVELQDGMQVSCCFCMRGMVYNGELRGSYPGRVAGGADDAHLTTPLARCWLGSPALAGGVRSDDLYSSK
jgi:hypothetical protein